MNLEQNNISESNQMPVNDKKRRFFLIALAVVVLSLVGMATYVFLVYSQKSVNNPANISDSSEYDQQESGGDKWSFGLKQAVFAKSTGGEVMVNPSVPFAKVRVDQIENLDSFAKDGGIEFSDEQKTALEEYGFFLVDNNIVGEDPGSDDFVRMYSEYRGDPNKYYREPDDAIFITSDTALHLYHILIDRSFQSIEETKFQPMLRSMTRALFIDSIQKYNTETDPVLKDSYKRLSVYYLVPLVVLDTGNRSSQVVINPEDFDTFAQYLDAVDAKKIENSASDFTFALDEKMYEGQDLSEDIYNLTVSELDLIQKAKGMSNSPLFTPLRPEFQNDYSQFKPRSHYTKNDILKSYFISMMWYGRMSFPLSSPELTRDALLITAQVNNVKVNDESVSSMWSKMADVIDFFVGEADDLTPYQYTDVIREVYGDSVNDRKFSDGKLLNIFIAKAKKDLPAPKIISELLWVNDDGGKRNELLESIKQFRFMGQRFTPDAYIINNLTQGVGAPEPETGQHLPSMPTALMPMHVLSPDNTVVKDYLDKWINDPARIEKQGRQSDKVIAKMFNKIKAEFADYDTSIWSKNIYWRWLDLFRVLLKEYETGYPSFMQTEAWQQKNLGAVLGSYTELKHDTLLYAKQSYAERGAGGGEDPELPPVVKGYVEPDMEFWNQIIDLAEVTRSGLESRGVFPEDYETKYQVFIDTSKFFRQLAEQELKNEKISDEDFEKLRIVSDQLYRVVSPINGQELTKRERRAGIIADIHTDGRNQRILYESTGKPYIIYVAVSDANGTRLTRGAVFNHYEFTDKLDERLSDEDWQATVYDNDGELPEIDEWSSALIR